MNLNDIRKYINKCIKDAYLSEMRKFDDNMYNYQIAIITDMSGEKHLYMLFYKCNYQRVTRRVRYRLQSNLYKNFGVHFGNTDEFYCTVNDNGIICYGETEFMLSYKGKNTSINIVDKNHKVQKGYIYGSKLYEDLVMAHYGLSVDELSKEYNENPNSKKTHLPDEYHYEWSLYKDLYNRVSKRNLEDGYEIIVSDEVSIL